MTREISGAAARIKKGQANRLSLGNLDAKRDWGFAGEYVKAMWRMLQQDEPDDYVIATGETHSVREFAETAFRCVGLNFEDYVTVESSLYRPAETWELCGNHSKASRVFDWQPNVTFAGIVEMMVEADLRNNYA